MEVNTDVTEIPWGETKTQVEKYAIEILEEFKANDYESSKGAGDIYKRFQEKYPKMDIPENTFRQVLSALIKDKLSRVTKQEGRYGYFLTTFPQLPLPVVENATSDSGPTIVIGVPEQASDASDTSKISKREFLLYPLLEQWLTDQNYKVAKNIFNKRSNETWGNPDIAGIRVEEHLSRFEIEITTIEAKPSKDQWGNNWRKDIFEAVSHKRYANRVYFSIAVRLGDKLSDLSELKYYCELYRVGLIIIEINPILFKDFEAKDISASGFTEQQKELIFITEKLPAPFDYVPLKYQREFCENTLQIGNLTELFSFGNDIRA